jgi:prepilin-type N-terminal cleavage/methylation domain-containing protein
MKGKRQERAGGKWRAKGPFSLDPRPSTLPDLRAFTLLEVMIVVAIMGVVMVMSLPIIYRMKNEAPLRKAVRDVVEVCSTARARAILQSKAVCVVFHPREGAFAVEGGGGSEAGKGQVQVGPSQGAGGGTHGQFSDRVAIDMLDVDMTEYKDADEVKVWFYPNGVCDELTLILHALDFEGDPLRAITFEVTTGLATVETDVGKLKSLRQ